MSGTDKPENALPPAKVSSSADVADILKDFRVLKRDSSDKVPLDKAIGDAFLAVVQDPQNASSCVSRLFPDGFPLDDSFFDRLHEFRRWIGISEVIP